MKPFFRIFTLLAALMLPAAVNAQLSQNKDKFLGNITTGWTNMDYEGFKYSDYWNQVTPENASKWDCVEGTKGSFQWYNCDIAYNYAKQKGFPFKFHCFVWGSQYPKWLKDLTPETRYDRIVKWMDAAKKKYPNLEMIDVVNEAVGSHQADTYVMREALGGDGETGYDWIIKAFEMAHERWPDAILIYNDFNTFQWDTDPYIDLVRTLRDAGAPIDAYGCQSHDLGGVSGSDFQAAMTKIQNAVKMPMYITEYDIADENDANQKWNYQQHFPIMWEADYCAGVTLWGWHYGMTWIGNGSSGLIKDKKERSALTWLREYMQTDKAKNARSPFPGMKKEASVYIKPATIRPHAGEPVEIEVRASMRTKTIQSVSLYANDKLVGTSTAAPYTFSYTPNEAGRYNLKAVVTTTDNATYERMGGFKATAALDVAKRFASLTEIGSTPFAIVDEAEQKAFYGINNQNLGFSTYESAFDEVNTGYQFKLVKTTGGYLLRLITPAGDAYSIWGSPGYLNSQPTTGNCCFILGLNNQNGQDIKNGALWDIQYVDGKGFSLKNVGTGKYLKTNDAAKYDEPTYFTFCTLAARTNSIEPLRPAADMASQSVYTLDGRRAPEGRLSKGIYIKNGKKFVVK